MANFVWKEEATARGKNYVIHDVVRSDGAFIGTIVGKISGRKVKRAVVELLIEGECVGSLNVDPGMMELRGKEELIAKLMERNAIAFDAGDVPEATLYAAKNQATVCMLPQTIFRTSDRFEPFAIRNAITGTARNNAQPLLTVFPAFDRYYNDVIAKATRDPDRAALVEYAHGPDGGIGDSF